MDFWGRDFTRPLGRQLKSEEAKVTNKASEGKMADYKHYLASRIISEEQIVCQ